MMVAIEKSYFMLDGVRFTHAKGDLPQKWSVGLEKFSAVVNCATVCHPSGC